MLRAEPDRRAKALAPSPDPRLRLVDDLLEALEARYTTEGRRSIGRLRFGTDQLLRLFKGVQAMRVSGADILRYAQLRLSLRQSDRSRLSKSMVAIQHAPKSLVRDGSQVLVAAGERAN